MKMPPMRVLPALVCVTGLLTGLKLLTLGEAALADERVSAATPGAAAAQAAPGRVAQTGAPPASNDAPISPPNARSATTASSTMPSPKTATVAPDNVEPLTGDLRARSAELDRRSAALDSEESALAAAREQLQTRLSELETLKATLASMEHDRNVRTEQDWAGLVRIYEAMRPANAAAIFDLLDTRVLIQVLDRMNDRKAAPILAAMSPERARLATQLLAQFRLKDDGGAKGTIAGRS